MSYDQEVPVDITYTFCVKQQTLPDYGCCTSIIQWLKNNLESLKDDYNTPLFSKVNYGYNEETLKGFGKKPVADVYINNIEYSSDLYNNTPATVTSLLEREHE